MPLTLPLLQKSKTVHMDYVLALKNPPVNKEIYMKHPKWFEIDTKGIPQSMSSIYTKKCTYKNKMSECGTSTKLEIK